MSDWEDDDAPPEGFRGSSEKVVQNSTYSNSRDSRTNNNFQRRKYTNPALTEYITIQIGRQDIGKLIGRGGSNIRELRDATGCQVIRFLSIVNCYFTKVVKVVNFLFITSF